MCVSTYPVHFRPQLKSSKTRGLVSVTTRNREIFWVPRTLNETQFRSALLIGVRICCRLFVQMMCSSVYAWIANSDAACCSVVQCAVVCCSVSIHCRTIFDRHTYVRCIRNKWEILSEILTWDTEYLDRYQTEQMRDTYEPVWSVSHEKTARYRMR